MRFAVPLVLLLTVCAGARAQEQAAPEVYLAVGPQALLDAAKPLLELRAREGLAIATWAASDADAAKRQAGARAQVARLRPRYLLLLGDVDALPSFLVREATTDRPYGDLDDDGFPEVAIGRLPFSDPSVLGGVVARICAYERERDAGLWRKQCALVAGEGRFSPVIDTMIERLFAQIVAGSIAPGYDVDLTYANPRSRYCYPPARFSQRVARRFEEGALVFAYVGHGQERSVDDLTVEEGGKKRRYDVLEAADAPGLQGGPTPPVFVAIACYTGRFEGKKPCIGEELLASPGGPVAFFGATRVSHPVHNALLAQELVRAVFSGTGALRLGPALDAARKNLVTGPPGGDPIRAQILLLSRAFVPPDELEREFPRHVDMYNLLGDPAMNLARPDATVDLSEAPPVLTVGHELVVRGRSPLGRGAVSLALETERERSARPDPGADADPVLRYVAANDRVLRTELAPTDEEGRFEVRIAVPADLPPGRYWLKAFASDREGRCAIGAASCMTGAAR